MRVRRDEVKKYCPVLSFAVVLIFNLYYLYLIHPYYYQICGIPAQDIALLIAIAWGMWYWVQMKDLSNPQFAYKKWLLFTVCLAVLSAYQSWRLHDQNFLRGLAPQRWMIIWAFMYFPLRKCIHYEKIQEHELRMVIVGVSVIQLFLFIGQYVLTDYVTFLHVGTGFREGVLRYYFSPVLLDLFFFYCLDVINKGQPRQKILHAIFAGLVLLDVMIVQRFRLTMMGLIVGFGLFLLFVKCGRKKKIVFLAFGGLFCVFLLFIPMVQDILWQVLTNNFDKGMRRRAVGRSIYFARMAQSPILGGGYPSSFYEPAKIAAGMDKLIYLYDNGIFGFMYIYGSVGVMWFLTLWNKLIRDGIKIYNRASDLVYVLYPVFFLVTCINELHWYWEYGFVVFCLYLCMMESRLEKLTALERENV